MAEWIGRNHRLGNNLYKLQSPFGTLPSGLFYVYMLLSPDRTTCSSLNNLLLRERNTTTY